jgi:hypothetical protein
MPIPPESLSERLTMLGLVPDAVPVPTDRITSAVAALACFPMYMVANVHAWSGESQFRVPLLDWPGSENVREAYALGQQEARLHVGDEHRKVLSGLLTHARPSDRIIYDYALETLKAYLTSASPAMAEGLRVSIARGIVAVAEASGKGFLGTGRKVTDEERACIAGIARELDLGTSTEAATTLQRLGG